MIMVNEKDRRIFSGDIGQWMSEVADPHEFATAFVNFVEKFPYAKDLFVLLSAIDHWLMWGSLEDFA